MLSYNSIGVPQIDLIEPCPPADHFQLVEQGDGVGKRGPDRFLEVISVPHIIESGGLFLSGFPGEDLTSGFVKEIDPGGIDGEGKVVVKESWRLNEIDHPPNRNDRNIYPCHLSHFTRIGTGRIHNRRREVSRPIFCLHPFEEIPSSQNLNYLLMDIFHTQMSRLPHEPLEHAVRIHISIPGGEGRADKVLRVEIGNELKSLFNIKELSLNAERLLKGLMLHKNRPVLLTSQKEVSPGLKVNLRPISTDLHPFTEFLIKGKAILGEPNIYIGAELSPDSSHAQDGGSLFVSRIFFKDSDAATESFAGQMV